MEGMAEASIEVTGNTVIDALLQVRERLRTDAVLDAEMRERFGFMSPSRRMVLVTGHRRENFGDGFEHICMALRELSEPRTWRSSIRSTSTRMCRSRSSASSVTVAACT